MYLKKILTKIFFLLMISIHTQAQQPDDYIKNWKAVHVKKRAYRFCPAGSGENI